MANSDKFIFSNTFNLRASTVPEMHTVLTDTFGWAVIDKTLYNSGVKSIDPRITHACDHECPHCWANLYGKHMNLETFEKILDLSEHTGVKLLQFTGGEPTLNKDMLKMAKTAKERGFTLILRSHGRHMPKVQNNEQTWAEGVTKYFDEVIVSMDGTANANFQMRPVINHRRLLKQVDANDYARHTEEIAQKQFEETVAGYEALTKAVANRKDISLKINTVIAKANMNNASEFGAFLSEQVSLNKFRVDCWDFTQVFPSPENSPEEQEAYVITEEDFFQSIIAASFSSVNVPKRAKPRTSARCLVVDETGRTYFGGEENHELGNINSLDLDSIKKRIIAYDQKEDLSTQRAHKYLTYTPAKRV